MRVIVLMSTYQGERYVQEQIDSILAQLPPDGQLMIRDDGSRDRTTDIIEKVSDPRVILIRGENIGFARSFLWLLAATPKHFDMIMLSDQDDVWLQNKISRAWQALQDSGEVPSLYCSRLQLVDEKLAPISVSPIWPRGPSFANALTENIVTGCTIAINAAGHSLVLNVGDERRIFFHDWWIYLVIAAKGRVIVDEEPTILYRQHGSNVIGRGVGIKRYLANLRFVRRQSWVQIMFSQIENFRVVHGGGLSIQDRHLLDRFNGRSVRSVMRFVLTPARHRQFLLDEFLLRVMMLIESLSGRALARL